MPHHRWFPAPWIDVESYLLDNIPLVLQLKFTLIATHNCALFPCMACDGLRTRYPEIMGTAEESRAKGMHSHQSRPGCVIAQPVCLDKFNEPLLSVVARLAPRRLPLREQQFTTGAPSCFDILQEARFYQSRVYG